MTDDLFNILIFLKSETLRPVHEAAIIESYSQKINKSGIDHKKTTVCKAVELSISLRHSDTKRLNIHASRRCNMLKY